MKPHPKIILSPAHHRPARRDDFTLKINLPGGMASLGQHLLTAAHEAGVCRKGSWDFRETCLELA